MTDHALSDETSETDLLDCGDCGEPFEFGSDEKRFYAEHGSKRPEYCLDCRARRRNQRNARLLDHYEKSLVTPDWQDHLGHFGGRSNAGDDRENERRGGYQATCSQCGEIAFVPFVPRNGRPVFCRSCYSDRKTRRTSNAPRRNRTART